MSCIFPVFLDFLLVGQLGSTFVTSPLVRLPVVGRTPGGARLRTHCFGQSTAFSKGKNK